MVADTYPSGPVGTARPDAWPDDGLERVERCPVCSAGEREVLHEDLTDVVFACAPGKWTLFRCDGCGSGYLDPRPTPETIGAAYATYYTHDAERPAPAPEGAAGAPLSSMAAKVRARMQSAYLNHAMGYQRADGGRLAARLAQLSPRDRMGASRQVRHLPFPGGTPSLLDVGCGNGAFLEYMQWQGWQVSGFDLDPAAVESARHRGLDVTLGSTDSLADLPDGALDAVTLSHVIEHVHEPVEVLKACRRVLRPGGLLSVMTPNLEAHGYRLFGPAWRGLEVPRHLVLFTRESLQRALEAAGFDVVSTPSGSWQAAFYYAESARAVEAVGGAPVRAMRLRAMAADWWALVRPSTAAEAAVLATPH